MSATPATGRLEIVRRSFDELGTVPSNVEGRQAGSVVGRAYAESPLRLLTPRNHGHAAWVYTGSYGGGLVGGDALRLAIRVAPEASAFVSTQASTKVYRSAEGTSVEIDGAVCSGGRLVMWPDPVVCFAGSTYEQHQRFEVEDGATLVLVDWMTSGRRGSGERWRFDRYSSRLTIRYDRRLVLRDSMLLAASDGDLAARMGRFDVLATAVLVGDSLRSHIDRILTDNAHAPLLKHAESLVAAAPLAGNGCLVRVAGRSVEDVGQILRRALSFVSCLLGDDPWARKW